MVGLINPLTRPAISGKCGLEVKVHVTENLKQWVEFYFKINFSLPKAHIFIGKKNP